MDSIKVPFHLKAGYLAKNIEASGERLFLFLHGYLQTPDIMAMSFQKAIGGTSSYLIPQGPFFVPYEHKNKTVFGYSWYFYNTQKDIYLVDYESSLDYLTQLLKHLKLDDRPLTIVGYSQGAYMGLQLALKNKQCDQLFCINGKVKSEYINSPIHFNIDLIHGEQDEIIPLEGVRDEISKIKGNSDKIKIHAVANSGHKADIAISSRLENLLLGQN